ncbi:MMPL family transporter [Streptomyces sp. NPDC002784]
MLLLMICLALGLSVDYEIFLLARIEEQYRSTGNIRSSILHGMASTGRLISASSLVVVTTMSALAMSRITSLQILGAGLALTVLLDATLVRALLVPAAMRLQRCHRQLRDRQRNTAVPLDRSEPGPFHPVRVIMIALIGVVSNRPYGRHSLVLARFVHV